MAQIEIMQIPSKEEDADCDDGDGTSADKEDIWSGKN